MTTIIKFVSVFTVLKIDSHVVKSDKKGNIKCILCKVWIELLITMVLKLVSVFTVEKIASRVEIIASEKAVSDKRIDYLEKQFKSLSHLQKNSLRRKEKVWVQIII